VKHLTLVAAAASAAALLLAAPAGAKNVSELKLCGPSACASIRDASLIELWEQSGAPRAVAAPPIGPFYRFETTVSAAPGEKFENGQTSMTWTDWYVLRGTVGILRGTSEADTASWQRVAAAVNARFSAAVKGIDPYPAPAITSATVGGRAVSEPASYARLFDSSWKRVTDRKLKGWKRIYLHSAAPSPWTDGKNLLWYAAKRHHLERDGTVVAVPKRVGAALASARALPASGAGGAQMKIAAFGIAAAVVAASLFAYRRRRLD
jgi:hypothetical protein